MGDEADTAEEVGIRMWHGDPHWGLRVGVAGEPKLKEIEPALEPGRPISSWPSAELDVRVLCDRIGLKGRWGCQCGTQVSVQWHGERVTKHEQRRYVVEVVWRAASEG